MIKCGNDTEIQVTIKQKYLEARMINCETYTKIQSCNETRKTRCQDEKWDTDTMIQSYNKMMKNWVKDDQLRDRCICTKMQNHNETKKWHQLWYRYKDIKL